MKKNKPKKRHWIGIAITAYVVAIAVDGWMMWVDALTTHQELSSNTSLWVYFIIHTVDAACTVSKNTWASFFVNRMCAVIVGLALMVAYIKVTFFSKQANAKGMSIKSIPMHFAYGIVAPLTAINLVRLICVLTNNPDGQFMALMQQFMITAVVFVVIYVPLQLGLIFKLFSRKKKAQRLKA